MNTSRRHAIAALTGAGLLWGTTVPLSKLALEWLVPGWLAAIRFGLAAVVLLAVVGKTRRGLRSAFTSAFTPAVLASGAIGYGGTVILQNAGIARTSVTHAALLIGAMPVLVAVIAALWQHTVARPVAWAGFALSLAGVGLVTAGGGGGGATLGGDGLVLASLLLAATFTVAQGRLLPGRNPVAVTAVQFLGAALAALAFSVITEGVPAAPAGPGPVLAVAALTAGGTLLPFTLFAYGQSRVSAEIAGAFLNLEPLVGAVAGAVVFGNPVGPAQVTGGAAILAGIGLSSLPLIAGRSGQVRAEEGQVGGRQPVARGLGLVPVRVDQRQRAGRVELGSVGLGEDEGCRGQVVGQLLGGARADDQRGNGGLAERVGQRHLGGRHPVPLADADERFHDGVQGLGVVDRRLAPAGELPRASGRLAVPAVLAGQQPAGQRAPDQDAEPLVDGERDQLVLGLAGLQGVVDLLADKTPQAKAVGGAQRLHQLPRGVVGGADVPHLARPDEVVQSVQRLVQRGPAVPLVHLVQVDVISAQAAQAGLAAGDDVVARQPGVVRAATHAHPDLGGHEHPVPAAAQDLAEDLLGQAA
jgi:O-acetylserine/cysteine efflux transporter